MAIYLPRNKIVQTRPSGLHELNNSELASCLSVYNAMTPDRYALGKHAINEQLLSTGNDTSYFTQTDDGLDNIYDGVASDAMALKTTMSQQIGNRYTVGLQFSSRNNGFTKYNFKISDNVGLDLIPVSNSFYLAVDSTNIRLLLGSITNTFSGAVIRDGNPHTYVTHVNTTSVHTITLFVDGQQFGTPIARALRVADTSNEINIGSGLVDGSRGLNGVLHNAFIATDQIDADAAKALSANPYQVLKPRKTYFVLGGAQSVEFQASATAQAIASATLNTQIPLLSSAVILATAAGTISSQANLSSQAAAITIADGNLSAQINLNGYVLANALAAAGLSSSINLATAAQNEATATGALSTGSGFAGNATAQATASASITVQILLQSEALISALATGGLTTQTQGLSGNASAQATASGALINQILMTAAPTLTVTANGAMTTAIPLQASAVSAVNVSGGLLVGVTFSADALVSALVTGDLTAAQGLSGSALIEALSTAMLSAGISLSGSSLVQAVASGALTDQIITLVSTPEFTVKSSNRNFTVCAQ